MEQNKKYEPEIDFKSLIKKTQKVVWLGVCLFLFDNIDCRNLLCE